MEPRNNEKPSQYEAQIAQELDSLNLSSDVDDLQSIEVGKVSEILGKKPAENKKGSGKRKKHQKVMHQVAGILSGTHGSKDDTVVLPTPVQQKKKVKKAIEKRTRKLVAEATKLERSKKFHAHRLEEIILEIRHLRSLLANFYQKTVQEIEDLYRRFVIKSK